MPQQQKKLALRDASPAQMAGRVESSEDKILNEMLGDTRGATGVKGRAGQELADQLIADVAASFLPMNRANQDKCLVLSVEAFEEMAPQNFTEGMLAGQMIGLNQAVHYFLARAMANNQPSQFVDANVLRVVRLTRVFGEHVDALQRLRGKGGQQRVVVEHVHVNAGGQAIVGAVTAVEAGEGVRAMATGLPHERRLGRLKNGNPPGDFRNARRCGAKNRRGTPCQCPAMRNGRCRLHGGLSTGPRTAEGLERMRQANTRHGEYSQRAKAERRFFRSLLKECQETLRGAE